jgi:hypothetical protein
MKKIRIFSFFIIIWFSWLFQPCISQQVLNMIFEFHLAALLCAQRVSRLSLQIVGWWGCSVSNSPVKRLWYPVSLFDYCLLNKWQMVLIAGFLGEYWLPVDWVAPDCRLMRMFSIQLSCQKVVISCLSFWLLSVK